MTPPLLAVSGAHRQECLCHPAEKWGAAIGAFGGELKFSRTVNTVVERYGRGAYTRGNMRPKESVPWRDRRRQKTGVCASRRKGCAEWFM